MRAESSGVEATGSLRQVCGSFGGYVVALGTVAVIIASRRTGARERSRWTRS